eukprot:6673979-Pyramimonas_sp.AAC.2
MGKPERSGPPTPSSPQLHTTWPPRHQAAQAAPVLDELDEGARNGSNGAVNRNDDAGKADVSVLSEQRSGAGLTESSGERQR